MLWVTFAVVITLAATSVWTATSTVSPSRAGLDAAPAGPNEIKPSECSSIGLSNIVAGSGTFSGGNSSDLVVAGAGSDTIQGLDGSDCILAGGGDDVIEGGPGADICLGGPGADEFLDCETQSQ